MLFGRQQGGPGPNLNRAINDCWTETYVNLCSGPPSEQIHRMLFVPILVRKSSAACRIGDDAWKTASLRPTNTFPEYHDPYQVVLHEGQH